ncbi:MAG: hypothetical protein HYZ29_28010 [Myxococcales bacterium]|nr:hypothetical protein [Myxococcales bacterium]
MTAQFSAWGTLCALLLAMPSACQSAEEPRHENPGVQPPAPQTQRANRRPLRLFPSDFAPGKTNVPVDARLAFAMDRTSGEPLDQAATLTAHAVFRHESSGEAVPAKVEVSEEKGNPASAFFYLVPTTILQSDAWYQLEISPSPEVQVLDGDGQVDTSAVWKRPFFTGSAPHVARVEVTSKSNQVRVEFSEPIEAKNLVASKVLLAAGQGAAKCLYLAGDCVAGTGADGPILRDLVFQVSGPSGKTPVVEVVVPFALKGSPRTVGEGKQVAGTSWVHLPGAGDVRFLSAARGKWRPCQQGAAECWSYER